MDNRKDKEHGSHQRDQRASDNPLSSFARQALVSGGYSLSPGPGEAQQYSSTPAPSGYVIPQPRTAPYQQGQLGGNTSSGGGYAGTAQYASDLTSEPQPLSGGYSGSAYQQTTEEHKRARESSSSSGDQQHEHGRSHHRHKKTDHGSGEHHHRRHHGSQRGESQGGGRGHHEPRHQPENQGANFTPAAPQYQPNPWQNTSWPTNAPPTNAPPTNATAAAGYGGGAGGGYGDDVRIERQPAPPAGLFPPAPRGWLPPMQLAPPQLAPMPEIPRQRQRWDELPPMLTEPPQLAPFQTQPQSGGLPSLQMESQQRRPMRPPVPTGMGTGPGASHSDDSPDPFNVAWQGHIFPTSQERPTRALTPLQLREARVVIASFATWDEASQLGQELPGGRTASTIARAVKRNYGPQWDLPEWHEWTRKEDLIIWEHHIPPPTESFRHVAARLHRSYFPRRMLGEVVGRLNLFARMGLHPDQGGRTIGGFPTIGLAEKNQAGQNR